MESTAPHEPPVDLHKMRIDYETNGYAIVQNYFSVNEIDEIRAEIEKIVLNFDPKEHPQEDFVNKLKSDYFMNSYDKIAFFYEKLAFDANGQLQVAKEHALHKIGHALHWLNPIFKRFTFSDKMKNLIKAIGCNNPSVVQGMYMFKPPNIGGAVRAHYDSRYLHVQPSNHLVGIWIAVDDATVHNGCLWFIPGSHKTDREMYRLVRTHDKSGYGDLLKYIGNEPHYDENAFVPAPVEKGSVIVIDGLVVHKSEPNLSDRSRHAYTFHVVEAMNETVWSADNW